MVRIIIDGRENEEEINNLRDVHVDFNEDIMTMNKTRVVSF